MIDLHMHTTYSDGANDVKNLIKTLNDKGIKYASITDHNSVDAHIEFRDNNYQELYNGKMISGVEIQTIVDDYLIEVLVYDYDLDALKEFVDESRRTFWEFHHEAYEKLLEKAKIMGLKYIEPNKPLKNGYYCNMKFQEAIAACYDYNKNIIDEKILSNHLHFYRNEFQRYGSDFYIDNKKAFPQLRKVIEAAHNAGGKVFLAHIDEYQAIPNKSDFLNYLVNNYDIDGIECFHPAINKENRIKYINYCKDNNLLISAGSDFHGPHLSHRMEITTEAILDDISWIK